MIEHAADAPSTGPALSIRTAVAGVLLLVVHALLIVLDARAMGRVRDEVNYFNCGHILLERGCASPYTMVQGPLAPMATQLFVREFPSGGLDPFEPDRELLLRGRLATLPFALLSAALVFLWSWRLFGERGGLVALLAHALNPLLLGYGSLMLVDAQATALTLLALYLSWRHLETRAFHLVPCIGIALGLALATKYLAVLLAPPLALTVAVAAWRARAPRRAWRTLGASVTLVLSALLTLHAAYLFREVAPSSEPADYQSAFVRRVAAMPVLGELSALLPASFVRGIDYFQSTRAEGWLPFLNGERASGHPDYYVWSILCKTPEVVLLGAALALVLLVRQAFRRELPAHWRTTLVACTPYALLTFVYLSWTPQQLGIRYVLPLVPLLFLLVARIGWQAPRQAPSARFLAALALAAALLGLDLRRNWPDWIAYYNSACGGQALAFRRFRDSNGDFGQYDSSGARILRERHGELESLSADSGARFGRLAIDSDALRAAPTGAAWLTWLEPVAHLGASWWLFELRPGAFEERVTLQGRTELRRDLALAYLGAGRRADAERHLALLDPASAAPLRACLTAESAALVRPEQAELEALIRAWLALERADRAEAVALEHAEVLERSLPATLARVRACEERGDLEAAIDLLRRAEIPPTHAARMWLVRDLQQVGRMQEAHEAFAQLASVLDERQRGAAFQELARKVAAHAHYLELLR